MTWAASPEAGKAICVAAEVRKAPFRLDATESLNLRQSRLYFGGMCQFWGRMRAWQQLS